MTCDDDDDDVTDDCCHLKRSQIDRVLHLIGFGCNKPQNFSKKLPLPLDFWSQYDVIINITQQCIDDVTKMKCFIANTTSTALTDHQKTCQVFFQIFLLNFIYCDDVIRRVLL